MSTGFHFIQPLRLSFSVRNTKNVFTASVDTITFLIQTGSLTNKINFLKVSLEDKEGKFELERSIEAKEIEKPNYIIPIGQNEESTSFIQKINGYLIT